MFKKLKQTIFLFSFCLIFSSRFSYADIIYDHAQSYASGVAHCFILKGENMPRYFDEEGVCDKKGPSIWTLPTFRYLKIDSINFERKDDYGIGTYLINFNFPNSARKNCSGKIWALYSGEDVSVKVKQINC